MRISGIVLYISPSPHASHPRAKEDVKEAHEKGIFNGKDNKMFDPISNIKRAEVAQVVVNMDIRKNISLNQSFY